MFCAWSFRFHIFFDLGIHFFYLVLNAWECFFYPLYFVVKLASEFCIYRILQVWAFFIDSLSSLSTFIILTKGTLRSLFCASAMLHFSKPIVIGFPGSSGDILFSLLLVVFLHWFPGIWIWNNYNSRFKIWSCLCSVGQLVFLFLCFCCPLLFLRECGGCFCVVQNFSGILPCLSTGIPGQSMLLGNRSWHGKGKELEKTEGAHRRKENRVSHQDLLSPRICKGE